MKRFAIAVLFSVGFFCSNAHAGLFTNVDAGYEWVPNGVIYDDVAALYWYQHMPDFGGQTYSEQIADIATLNDAGSAYLYAGIGEWHMAKCSEMEALLDNRYEDIALNFEPTLGTFDGFVEHPDWYTLKPAYWIGRFDEIYDDGLYVWPDWHAEWSLWYSREGSMSNWLNTSSTDPMQWHIYDGGRSAAWICAKAVSPVPEPATMLLVGSGLAGLVGMRRKAVNGAGK